MPHTVCPISQSFGTPFGLNCEGLIPGAFTIDGNVIATRLQPVRKTSPDSGRPITIEQEMRDALRLGQFELHYQVQTDSTGSPVGAEALVRWSHPERGMISPGVFIPAAEQSGFIVELGRWILEEACRQLGQWTADPLLRDLTLAVNVSALQFRQPGFVASVGRALRGAGVSPERLKLELTESVAAGDSRAMRATLEALKALGVRLSLDDFGTGYSSLSYLQELPIDQIKIDRSFVIGLGVNCRSDAIIGAIVALSDVLGMEVIAEGVETETQKSRLEALGCRQYQGYLYSAPLSSAQFRARVGELFGKAWQAAPRAA